MRRFSLRPPRRGRAERDLRRLEDAPFVRLGRPTPVELGMLESGHPLLVKRDDKSGFGRGGAKARKLSHLLGWMRARGSDHLVTAAGNVTNLGFDLVEACDRHGIELSLFILDDPPLAPEVRNRVFAGVAERVELVGNSHPRLLASALAAYRRARSRGREPVIVLPGVSHPSALVGNACGFLEMARSFIERREPLPDAVFVTAATGTTIGGFLIGASVLAGLGYPRIRVLGAQIYPGAVSGRTLALIRWTERALGLECAVPREAIEISSCELGDGFGHFDERLVDLCKKVEAEHGFSIDPIFGGKTWALMQGFV
ncbi:MAG TPA: pyridoxal-phosphate dependent enzyme, partial [Polyangiaceae bacterium]|nr:pyridoxal-phosphate dependent enzyme [Polyangiaceae bacterium]